jgi:DNA invertase Pin-like site-specific DNA recombinase
MELDGYIRVSHTRRDGDGISPDVQRDQIKKWAKLRGVKIAAWHEDLDQSGGKLNRPGLEAMLARIPEQTSGVVVAKLDRLSRLGVADALKLVERITTAGGTLATADGDVDLLTASGEFQLTVMLALARMERRRLSDSWDESQERAIGRGIHFRAPFGYEKPAKGAAIEPNPDTAPLVEQVFERRAAGESWPQLAAFLNDSHPPNHAARWTHSTVAHLIRNRAYLGEASHGKHIQPDAHPALVSAQLWDAANVVSGRAPSRNGGDGSLLTGLVRCAGCRHTMTPGETQGGGRKTRLLVYRCRRNHGGGKCTASCAVKRELVEEYVERAFLERYSDISVGGVDATSELDQAQRALDDAEFELKSYRDNESVRDSMAALGDQSFEDGIASRVERVLAARERLSSARTSAVGFEVPDEVTYWSLTVPERRRLLRAGIGAIFVRRSTVRGRPPAGVDVSERVRILWHGDEPDDLPGRHLADVRPLVSFDW